MTPLCTSEDVQRKFSVLGVTEFTDHSDATDPTEVVDDCITQASEELYMYLAQKYSEENLVTSDLVNRWATTVATYYVSCLRGNPASAQLEREYLRILDPEKGLAKQVLDGKLKIPDLAGYDQRPTMSNLRIDRRYHTSKVRVTRPNSSDTPSVLPKKWAGDGTILPDV